ncbi:MAG: valine--tRNA ligase [Candidatus Euphemobacter frigidus]|nr:valine--tRNA ligase [Candidatus Euphemobacter frigidus]
MAPDQQINSSWPSRYNPNQVERDIYRLWEDHDCFTASPGSPNPYVIVIPPPNITGILTMGHVLNNTLQDILIRWQRMRGREALWLPGTDHAGIATQNVVEKKLAGDGITRERLGREKFIRRVWEWKAKYGGTIIKQLKKLGCSCDWSRERFTLDPGLSRAVREVFITLYRKGLVYRGSYLINWCPRCHTALSDEEVEHEEKSGSLWYIRYPLKDNDGWITVATTRPETMLGDTAVAVHPEDSRYRSLIGRTVVLPFVEREIPIIADDSVDSRFGTGAVKVTPAHDPNDYLLGKRHNLPEMVVMDTSARMNENAGAEFKGLDRFECRDRLVARLKDLNLLEKVEDHTHAVGQCYRCHTVIEPYHSVQWFVRMKPLAEPALQAVREGEITFYPERWVKVYQHWMENIRDWCISRQLWWGHRIPAWYRGDEIYVGEAPPEGSGWRQDEDVLDTWFSSWLWPFSTLGWPDETPDLKAFYPTSDLVTGPDIIFFWVARMIMAGLEFRGEVPFRKVYFTGIIRDMEGRKMSKSLGNSPDPLDVIDKYGADALRFTIARLSPIGQDIYYSNSLCELGRNFSNKIWNASRFVAGQSKGENSADPRRNRSLLSLDDRYILDRLERTIADCHNSLRRFHFNDTAVGLYDFFWHHFCDRYIESAKFYLSVEGDERQAVVRGVLFEVLTGSLKLLHPFMPFITEEIWRHLGQDSLLIRAAWPEMEKELLFPEVRELAGLKYDIISGARNLRKEYELPVSRKVTFVLKPSTGREAEVLAVEAANMGALIKNCLITVETGYQPSKTIPSSLVSGCEIYMPLEGVIDPAAEREKFEKKLKQTVGALNRVRARLDNADFLTKAPVWIREKNRSRQEELTQEVATLKKILSTIK